jgi:hypothetical protein
VIVRTTSSTIQLITQPDHARLARQVMERCVPLASRPRRDAILHAVGEHDNGWTEEDATPRVHPITRQVVDFINAPASIRQHVWPRGVGRLADDPWAAALVAQHSVVIYDRYRADPEWEAFFAQMESLRSEMLDASGLPLEELLSDYPFVRLADLVSLSFCTGSGDELRVDDWRVRLTGTRVVVKPDPFGGAEVPAEIAMREIRNQSYDSDAALRLAVRHAGSRTLRGMVTGG